MFIIIFLLLFFLIWTFFLATISHSMSLLGEKQTLTVLKKHRKRFFYYSLHRLLFKKHPFELLRFTLRIGESIGWLGYAAMAALAFFEAAQLGLSWIQGFGLVVLFAFLILLLGDFFPRLWAVRAPKEALSASSILGSFFLYLCFPITFLFAKLADVATKDIEKERSIEKLKETVVHILQTANIKGKLNASDKKLIESVVKFKDRIVREVMVPRVNLFTISADTPIKLAAKPLVEEGYSRIPVYRDNIDNIMGVLMFKDILQLYMDCAEGKKEISLLDAPVETITKHVFYTPETKKVSHLLQELRAKQLHMAIVVDEYGGTEGVVTMEDILEEIVGEIADEYDTGEERLYTAQPGGSWTADARMSILDAEDIFGIHIPQDGDYDTIGGYIFHKIGSIPPKGLKIHHEDFDLEILSSSERSVEKVKIIPFRRTGE